MPPDRCLNLLAPPFSPCRYWKDTRLAWDPAEYGGVTSTYYTAANYVGDSDVAEIWTPDIKMSAVRAEPSRAMLQIADVTRLVPVCQVQLVRACL